MLFRSNNAGHRRNGEALPLRDMQKVDAIPRIVRNAPSMQRLHAEIDEAVAIETRKRDIESSRICKCCPAVAVSWRIVSCDETDYGREFYSCDAHLLVNVLMCERMTLETIPLNERRKHDGEANGSK